MNPAPFASPDQVMQRALELARRGIGLVEPNPPVGAVIVDDRLMPLGEGWHERYGAPHAEVSAIARSSGTLCGATMYVTLEPCCHFGKTPPCVDALIAAGLKRVVVATSDPFPQVAGQGIRKLRDAGIEVDVGLLEPAARRLIAPFQKLVETGRPWVHAKWAMTLDGKIASRTGESKWISNESSRAVVHALRGRMDAIVVGIGTVRADDPLLMARPAGPRVAARVVLDRHARLPLDSQLVRTIEQAPLLVFAGPSASAERTRALRSRGAEVIQLGDEPASGCDARPDARAVLVELGRRRMTNVLVEGGGEILGSFFDDRLIDEVHAFIAPKLLGGSAAKSPLSGWGLAGPNAVPDLDPVEITTLGDDVCVHGFVTARARDPQS